MAFSKEVHLKNHSQQVHCIVPCAFFSCFSTGCSVNTHVSIAWEWIIQYPSNSLIRNYRSFLTHSMYGDSFFSSLLTPIPWRVSFYLLPGVGTTVPSLALHYRYLGSLGWKMRKLSSLSSLLYHNHYFIVWLFSSYGWYLMVTFLTGSFIYFFIITACGSWLREIIIVGFKFN